MAYTSNYKTKIKNFSLEHDQIVGVNIDDVIIKIPYTDIVRISIMVYEEDLLPQPIWTVQTIKDIIDIPNELNRPLAKVVIASSSGLPVQRLS